MVLHPSLQEGKLSTNISLPFCPKIARYPYKRKYLIETDSPRRLEVATATTGAMHELLVCADLMRRGYDVFRAQSPSCPCDVIAMIDGQTYKVEVTTGYMREDGQFSYPKKNNRYDYDIIAIVFHNGDILYLQRTASVTAPNITFEGAECERRPRTQVAQR